MEPDRRLIICDRCKKSVPISSIRYVPVGKDTMIRVCSNCRTKGGEKEKITSASAPGKEVKPKRTYYCSRCNYKFKYDPNSNITLRCPYCAKADKLEESNEVSADKLIREADE
jgi:transcription initiation factor IIE alpha subunit